jgi:hypothetical protein
MNGRRDAPCANEGSFFAFHAENHTEGVIVRGGVYPFDGMFRYMRSKNIILSDEFRAKDISGLFYDTSARCSSYSGVGASSSQCSLPYPYSVNSTLIAKPCLTFTDLHNFGPRSRGKLSFQWTDLNDLSRRDLDGIIVYDGKSK